MRRAALLIQLGSPDSPATGDVRRYLAQFLSDPRVLDIPWLPRMALLYGAILPFRPKKSGEAYQKIWTADGSPLVNLTRRQVVGVAERRPDLDVYGAMRYGRPSIDEAVAAIAKSGADEVVVVPLYPQYASASSGSSLEAVYRAFGRLPFVPAIRVVPPFYADPQWINVWAERTREVLAEGPADHVLFSFHGLPERQIARCDPTGAHCFQKADCCDVAVAANHACYRHQCVVTAKLIAASLSLPSWSVSFQSRLGNTPWIQPYTDVVVPELARSGKRRVVVACPSFTTDCLETLEEIGIRAQADFEAAGGESLRLVPCPNDHPRWLDALASLVGEVAHPSPVMGEGRALPPPSLRAHPSPSPLVGEGRAHSSPSPLVGEGRGGGQEPP